MKNKLVEEAPYHPGYEDAGFKSKANNEPVAWMGKDYDGIKTDFYFDVERNKLPYRLYETAIPLYTHPAKTLTDDPLVNFKPVWIEKPELTLTDEEINEVVWKQNLLISNDGLREFARAILRKAQEK
jgi:hypothetical protein